MAGSPNVRLRLSNRAENVLLVRQALSGLAEAVGLDPVALNDISTAVTEASNNVVLHAYEGGEGEGPMEVELTMVAEGLDAVVRDHGIGIRPGVTAAEELSGGIGLPVIQALSETVEFRDLPGGGTEVAMHFEASASSPPPPTAGEEGATLEAIDHGSPGEQTLMTVAPTQVARGVVPRVLSTLAARAYFSTDRISDTQMLADALVAHTDGEVLAGHLGVGVSVGAAQPRDQGRPAAHRPRRCAVRRRCDRRPRPRARAADRRPRRLTGGLGRDPRSASGPARLGSPASRKPPESGVPAEQHRKAKTGPVWRAGRSASGRAGRHATPCHPRCDEDRRGRAAIRRLGNTGNPFLPLPAISKHLNRKALSACGPCTRPPVGGFCTLPHTG